MRKSVLYATLQGGGHARPPRPSRNAVCGVKMSFQGLRVSTAQFGPSQPWFEPAYQCLFAFEDRAAVRRTKKTAGDTHLILEFFTNEESIYDESGQPWQQAITPSMERNLPLFRSLVEEVIDDGLIPVVAFDGDDGERGHFNALRQLPILAALLGDLSPYILFARLWDGVFYGSTPEQIVAFGRAFRVLLPDGYLAIEHQPGRIPIGNGPADWLNGGGMQSYDVLLHELQDRALEQDSTWQVAGRVLGPAYRRPLAQPTGDDPSPPWYFRDGTPRGPYFPVAFEYFAYEWVRSRISDLEVRKARAYLASLGYTYVC